MARRRLAAPTLFGIALVVYWLQALAWPVQRGRDAWDYLVYYLSYADSDTPFLLVMLMRTPFAALGVGLPLDLGGAAAMELVMGLAYAATIVLWAAVARWYSGTAAVLSALLLLAIPTTGLAFHEASSDYLASLLFATYALAVVRAWRAPSGAAFALVGLCVAALVLTRPAYQALVLGAVVPLLTPGPVRSRLARTAVFAACAVAPLAAWAVHNDVRYGELTVSRAGVYNIPFYSAFRAGEINPANGPASRRLAARIRRDVLSLPPYRALRVDVATYLQSRSNLEAVRLAALNDRLDGVEARYALLRRAAREVPATDGPRLAGIGLARVRKATWQLASVNPVHESRLQGEQEPPPSPTVDVGGRPFPNPILLGIPAGAETYGFLACAGDEIARCILANPAARYADARQAARYREITDQVRRWNAELGTRSSVAPIDSVLDRLTHRLPPPWIWAVIAVVGLAVRRPSGWPALLWLVLAAGGMLVVHAVGVGPDLVYALPVLPAWIVAAVCALSARREPPPSTLA